jgi:hypothetical protein
VPIPLSSSEEEWYMRCTSSITPRDRARRFSHYSDVNGGIFAFMHSGNQLLVKVWVGWMRFLRLGKVYC